MEEKNLQLERLVFFCDAVVAIAITLLAFNLKIEHTVDGHLRFTDIFNQWKVFAAFLLSFFNIANYWKAHHTFFVHIKKIDEKMLWYNILWLLFIVLLPFSTTLVSTHFFDTPAIFIYSLNILMIALFQNYIWDYASVKPEYLKDTIDKGTVYQIRLFCNLDMINGLIAIAVSFFFPAIAFLLLFTKLPLIIIARLFFKDAIRGGRK